MKEIDNYTARELKDAMSTMHGSSPIDLAMGINEALNALATNIPDIGNPTKQALFTLYANMDFCLQLIRASNEKR